MQPAALPKPSRLMAAPPLQSGRLPFQGSRWEPTNSAHNLSPSTRSEPFGPNKHRTDRLWQYRRQRLRRGEREAKISSVNSLNYPPPVGSVLAEPGRVRHADELIIERVADDFRRLPHDPHRTSGSMR